MRRYDASRELSLRHLPNISDVSFQIPNTPSQGDYLLGEDDTSFLRDMAGASMATPGPSKTTFSRHLAPHEPPARPLPMCTPDGPCEPRALAKARLSPKKLAHSEFKLTPRDADKGLTTEKPKLMTQSSDNSVTDNFTISGSLETPTASMRASNDAPNDAFTAATFEPQRDFESRQINSKRDRPIARSRRMVIANEGSTMRGKNTSATPTFPLSVQSGPDSQQNSPKHTKLRGSSDNEDLTRVEQTASSSMKPIAIDDVVGRPSGHSLQPPDSSGPLTSKDITSAPPTNPGSSAQIYKISPSKSREDVPSTRFGPEPNSPMRLSTKRPASIDPDQRVVKKGKVSVALASEESGTTTINLQSTTNAQAPTNVCSSNSQNGPRTVLTRAVREKKTSTHQAPKPSTSRHGNRTKLGPLPATRAQRNNDSSSADNSADQPRTDKRVEFLPPVIPTKPVEFKFQMDERIEARKAEQHEKGRSGVSQKTRKQSYQVPDYKTMHAIQNAKLAHLKENIVPVRPLSFGLNTEGRAREREKFNEHIREKEKEQERERELKRKEREEMEAQEIKELRRKAIPKAHEVPEWYKDAPKRKKRVDINGG